MSEQRYIKKKNLFKFFKSKEFNEARVLMCAIYILLSYVNELIEKVDRLLQGFDGMMIGMLKHKAKQATKAFDEYFKEYELHIEGGCDQLCDTTIIATTALDTAIKQSEFFLGESTKAIRKAIEEQMKENIHDEKQLEKEKFAGFEIFDPQSRKETLEFTLMRVKAIYKDDPNLETRLEGVRKGFNTACDYVNEIYLKS
jgi:tRNA 2-selenouridine synthase SelU